MLSTSHSNFHGAHLCLKLMNHHCERYSLVNRLLVPLFNVESLVRSLLVSVYTRFIGCLLNTFLPPKKILTGSCFFLFFFIFIAHYLLQAFAKFTSFINLVHLVTFSFHHLFQPNIRYSSSVTSLTRGGPRMVTRRYSSKNCRGNLHFHKTWSSTRHGVSRDVEYSEA